MFLRKSLIAVYMSLLRVKNGWVVPMLEKGVGMFSNVAAIGAMSTYFSILSMSLKSFLSAMYFSAIGNGYF